MDIKQILDRLDMGITTLLQKERDTLTRGLNELNVSTHLSFYLKPLFLEYNVDPEYNGDIDKPNDRKALDIAKNRIREVGRDTNAANSYKIAPDIIIHRRGSNEHNLVAIEVKKDIHSRKDKDFDLIKLEHLTIDYLGNHYNYNVGVAIVLGTKENAGNYSIKYFQNGIETCRDKLS